VEFQLNFLSTTADRRTRLRLRNFTALIYLFIFLGTLYVMYQIYATQKYMADVYELRVHEVERRIASVEPRMLFLERKIGIRNRLRNQTDLYLQPANRPSVWKQTLVDIAKALPWELAITKIQLIKPVRNKKKKKKGEQPLVVVEGYTYLEEGNRDILSVDNFKSQLMYSLPISENFSEIKVDENRIYKEDENLKLIFGLGFYK